MTSLYFFLKIGLEHTNSHIHSGPNKIVLFYRAARTQDELTKLSYM